MLTEEQGPNTGGQFVTAAEHGHFRKKCIRISTGSKQLDACLNGCVNPTRVIWTGQLSSGSGFQTMSISEVFGEFSEFPENFEMYLANSC